MLSAGAERDFMQDCTKNELMMAVRTVMINWMMVFHRLRFLNIADSFLGHTVITDNTERAAHEW